MTFAQSKQGAVSIELGLLLPAFLMTVLLVFEIVRFFFVNIQLMVILEQTSWESKIGRNRDIAANSAALTGAFTVQLVDPAKLRIAAFSAPTVAGIATIAAPNGTGGPNDVVRYELRYDYSFFGTFDEPLGPVRLEFVEIRRNEPAPFTAP